MSFEEVASFLSSPETHGQVEPIEVVNTHAASVFLATEFAYKIKRPVKYEYLDFSTLPRREAMLRRELELNKRTAPEIYLDVIPITRDRTGGLAIGGDDSTVEWCLRMRRFPDHAVLSEVAEKGGISRELAEQLGIVIADLHAHAEIRRTDGFALLGDTVREVETALSGMTGILTPDAIHSLETDIRSALKSVGPLLSKRSEEGQVRRGHGDLHLGNLVLLDGRPVLFDALEFDERLATVDVFYDLAFLIMDLLHRDLGGPANTVLNSYLYRMGDPDHLDGLAALPLFLSLRASIRAMVAVQTRELSGEANRKGNPEAADYLAEALDYLHPPAPRLVAIGGLSGTGKTTIARRLAPQIGAVPGAIHLRSDLERKALFGVDPLTRLPQSAYTKEAGARVYAIMLEKADRVLRAGQSVVLDAVFLREDEREKVRSLAKDTGVAMNGLWLEADAETMVKRVKARRNDASDAGPDIVEKQLGLEIDRPDWKRIPAGGPLEATVEAAMIAIGEDRT